MQKVEFSERELTLREAAQALGVSPYQLRYALMTRTHVPRRMAGHTTLVTLSNAERALADVGRSSWSSIAR